MNYWREPVWMIVNDMIANRHEIAGQTVTAAPITAECLRLIDESGLAAYNGPIDAEPSGGDAYTRTAARVFEIFDTQEITA